MIICGTLGMAYRFVLIIRTFIVSLNWFQLFSRESFKTIPLTILTPGFSISRIYLAIKFVYLGILFWDCDRLNSFYMEQKTQIQNDPDIAKENLSKKSLIMSSMDGSVPLATIFSAI